MQLATLTLLKKKKKTQTENFPVKFRIILLPLIKERDELDDDAEALASDGDRACSIPGDPELTLRLKTCTVPLSLETASHCALGEKAKL